MSMIFVFKIISALVVVGAFWAGFSYMRAARTFKSTSGYTVNRQDLAKKNREKVGVVNFGTSMDADKVYLVSGSQLGICE